MKRFVKWFLFFLASAVILCAADIIFMEGKAWDTIKEWLSFGAQFIP